MTVERRMVVGFDDVKAVTFECRNCKARTTIQAADVKGVPRVCSSCNAIWWTGTDISSNVSTSAPAAISLIQAIVTLRTLIRENKDNFRVLLEFEEPKPAS